MPQNSQSQLQMITDVQLAYIAGFIDGDGCVTAQIVRRNDYILKFQIKVTILILQKKSRLDHLLKIQKELGGVIRKDRGDGISELSFVGINTVGPLINKLAPYSRLKKKQMNLIKQIIEQLPLTKQSYTKFLELCQLVDQVSLLNDVSQRTITYETVRKHYLDLGVIKE